VWFLAGWLAGCKALRCFTLYHNLLVRTVQNVEMVSRSYWTWRTFKYSKFWFELHIRKQITKTNMPIRAYKYDILLMLLVITLYNEQQKYNCKSFSSFWLFAAVVVITISFFSFSTQNCNNVFMYKKNISCMWGVKIGVIFYLACGLTDTARCVFRMLCSVKMYVIQNRCLTLKNKCVSLCLVYNMCCMSCYMYVDFCL